MLGFGYCQTPALNNNTKRDRIEEEMKKAKLNLIIDILMFLAFLGTAFSGIVFNFILSISGFRGGRTVAMRTSFLGLDRVWWKNTHTYTGLIMVGFVIVHLILHLSYIKNIKKLWRTT